MNSYAGVPEIKDENKKVRERIHYISGAQIIEITYGVVGYYLGIQSEGEYKLLLHRHTAEEGGNTEYGPIQSDEPLKVIEEGIRKKQEILAEARAAMQGEEYDTEAADAILKTFDEIPDRNTPKEQEFKALQRSMLQKNKKIREQAVLKEEQRKAREEARAEREEENGYRRDAKQELIKEAKSFADSKDYSRAAADRMRAINDEWKKIGPVGRKEEQALWKELREAQDAYWQGKRDDASGRHQQWIDNTKAAIARRQTRITGISANLEKLRNRLETSQDDEKKEQIQQWIEEDEKQLKILMEEKERMEHEIEKGGRREARAAKAAEEPAQAEPKAAAEPEEKPAEAAAEKADEAAAAVAEEAPAEAE